MSKSGLVCSGKTLLRTNRLVDLQTHQFEAEMTSLLCPLVDARSIAETCTSLTKAA